MSTSSVEQADTSSSSSRLRGYRTCSMMIIVLLGCLVIGGTTATRMKRVVGGFDIKITEAPYQVSIRSEEYHICGGSLISDRHVLTAAHCVSDLFAEPYDELTVVTGSHSLKSGGTVHNVQNITWHEDFIYGGESFWNHDIAIITLRKDVKQNAMQRAILLPIKDAPLNVTGLVTGFGRTVTENPYLSSTLRGMKSTILTSDACKKFAVDNKILDNQICGMQPKGVGICKGDSGGPLAYDGRIIGIASWNRPQPCGSEIPDVYTNVYRYLDFIRKVMKVNDPITSSASVRSRFTVCAIVFIFPAIIFNTLHEPWYFFL